MEKIDNIVTVSLKLKEVGGFRHDELGVLLLGDALEIFELVGGEQINDQLWLLKFLYGVDDFVEAQVEQVHEGLEVQVALEGQKKTNIQMSNLHSLCRLKGGWIWLPNPLLASNWINLIQCTCSQQKIEYN